MRWMAFGPVMCGAMLATAVRAEDAPTGNSAPGDIVVIGQALERPVVAGKADIPLLETPQAISVVSKDQIEARGLTRLGDALRTVAGVSASSTYGFYDSYTIRGYDAAYSSIFVDGLVSEAGVGARQELFGLEQIEVIKGPASMLFGQAPLGGLVNLVSKRPQDRAFLDVRATTGSWKLGEGAIDANAPLNADGTILARISFLYRDGDSFVRYAGQNRIFLAPALTWKIGPDTNLTLLGRWQRDHDNPQSPLPAYGTLLPNPALPKQLPIGFSINGSGRQKVVNYQERKQIGYVFDHRFSDALNFSQSLRYTYRTNDWDRWMFAAGFIDADGNATLAPTATLGRYFYGPYRATYKDFAVDSRLQAKFATGPARHEILAGIDYRQNRQHDISGGDFDPTHNPLNLLAPDYSMPLVGQGGAPTVSASRTHQTGIYLQDHLKFGEAVTLTLGGRYDWAEANRVKDSAFSPRVGATVQIIPGARAYASWSKSFVPQGSTQIVEGVNPDGSLILGQAPPERGENIEAGVKLSAPSGKLSGTLAIYQLTRSNVTNPDPKYPLYSVVTGEQRSRGIEIEGQWQPLVGLTLNAAYAYIDAKVTDDTVTPIGTRLQNVPRHNLGLFARYDVQQGPLKNLGATVGMTYNSWRNGSLSEFTAAGTPLLRLPAYVLFDAGLSYRFDGWGVQVNVANLFDKRYFPDASGTDRLTAGQPRSWRLTLSRSFR